MTFRHQQQRELDVAQFQRASMQIRLEKVRIRALDTVPSPTLPQKLCSYKINDMTAAEDTFPKSLKRVLTRGIMMLVNPRRVPCSPQFPEDG